MDPAAKEREARLSRRTIVVAGGTVGLLTVLAQMGGWGAPPAVAAPVWNHPFAFRAAITRGFGPRPAPCAGCSREHKGTDYALPKGTPIYAVAAGTVISRVNSFGDGQFASNSFGNNIVIDHGEGYSTRYAHLHPNTAIALGPVRAGQAIGQVGHNGASTGPHLHLELTIAGAKVNAAPYIQNAPLPGSLPTTPEPEEDNNDMMFIQTDTTIYFVGPGGIKGIANQQHLALLQRVVGKYDLTFNSTEINILKPYFVP